MVRKPLVTYRPGEYAAPVLTSIPVAVLTAFGSKEDRELAHTHHSNGYLIKPLVVVRFRNSWRLPAFVGQYHLYFMMNETIGRG